ncbi:retron St85 family RNA-directed DNA polymerase [Desulfovibrio desulfuricans]|uniref:retron St85 family RNA-directed DNA polymerase n=1 Tax=Desulfovibrio desulfuricans TaxID=876 RepID=UPI001AE77FEF|nr:retron St85 family RNA-directed DNA polymerase [Desulfovibrio desulfuricans]QTO41263.1 retron St85 family RNA-directed DNA polymerase [Desulfovibrio desulfuricans]
MLNSALITYFSVKTGLDKSVCLHVALSAPKRYKAYSIPKRNGEMRTIAQPTPVVKHLQRLALRLFDGKLPIHKAATAYRKGSSIVSNVSPHLGNSFILKTDFNSFFNSIKPQDLDLLDLGGTIGLKSEEVYILKHLFFWLPKGASDFCLSIGAPSSPMLSNYLLFQIDTKIYNYCIEHNIEYTRYSDDITLSTDKKFILKDAYDCINGICTRTSSPSLVINQRKTVFTSKKHKRFITGLVISNDEKISLGREKRRLIKSILFNFVNNKETTIQSLEQLNGLLAFAAHIEPEYVMRLCKQYEAHLSHLYDKGVFLIRYASK